MKYIKFKKSILIIGIFVLSVLLSSCHLLQVANLANCKFQVVDAGDITWAGINISQVSSVKDLKLSYVVKATQAIKNKDFKVSFNMNVNVQNPGKYSARVMGYEYEVYLDDQPLATGSSREQEYLILPGKTVQVPVPVTVDLKNILTKDHLEHVINFAKNVADFGKGQPSKIQVKLIPYLQVGSSSRKLEPINLNKTFQ